jgi:hypothetical protein
MILKSRERKEIIMAYKQIDNLIFENAKLIFRNFTGTESEYNAAGNRNFCVIIDDPEIINGLAEDGWNVKIWAPREEGDEPIHYLKINVSFGNYPPRIYLIKDKHKIIMDESSIGSLDYVRIKSADLTVSPYSWKKGAKQGISAYLKTLYIIAETEDAFQDKYPDDLPFDV